MKRLNRIQINSTMISDLKTFRKSNKITQHKLSAMIKAPYPDYMMNFENKKIFSITKDELHNINNVRGKSYLPISTELFVEDLNDETLLYLEEIIRKEKKVRGIKND